MKINLATGINPSLNVCASLLSYLLPRPRLDQAHRELRLAQASNRNSIYFVFYPRFLSKECRWASLPSTEY